MRHTQVLTRMGMHVRVRVRKCVCVCSPPRWRVRVFACPCVAWERKPGSRACANAEPRRHIATRRRRRRRRRHRRRTETPIFFSLSPSRQNSCVAIIVQRSCSRNGFTTWPMSANLIAATSTCVYGGVRMCKCMGGPRPMCAEPRVGGDHARIREDRWRS